MFAVTSSDYSNWPSTLLAAGAVLGELLVAFFIWYEVENHRLDRFLDAAEQLQKERELLFSNYCALVEGLPRNEQMIALIQVDDKLREAANANIRLMSRIGAGLPRLHRKQPLGWLVVVYVWEVLGPYAIFRRRLAGSTYAEDFLRYAQKSAKALLKQDRKEWTVFDPNQNRKCDVKLSRARIESIVEEIDSELNGRSVR